MKIVRGLMHEGDGDLYVYSYRSGLWYRQGRRTETGRTVVQYGDTNSRWIGFYLLADMGSGRSWFVVRVGK